MTTLQCDNKLNIKLPDTTSIDIRSGLKHCNQNRALYFKVLNSFVRRYQDINLQQIDDPKRTLHSLKGLTATLGMNSLNQTIIQLEESFEPIYINNFEQELNSIVEKIISI